MNLSFYRHARDNAPRSESITWDEFCERFSQHKEADQEKTRTPAFSPAEYLEGAKRKNSNVLQVWLIVLDYDGVSDDEAHQILDFCARKGWRYFFYTSYRHGSPEFEDNSWRFRLVLDLSQPVSGAAWKPFIKKFLARLPVQPDEKCVDASRIFFLPYTPYMDTASSLTSPGGPVDVPEVLSGHATSVRAKASAPSTIAEVDTIRSLSAKLMARTSPRDIQLGSQLRQIMDGRRFALEGSRHDSIVQLTFYLERQFPGADLDQLAEVFRDSLETMYRDGKDSDPMNPDEGVSEVRVALEGAREKRQSEEQEQEQDEDARVTTRIRLAFSRFGIERTTPYTEDEVEKLRQQSGYDADIFKRTWVIVHGTATYFRVLDEYAGPIPERLATVAAERDLAPAQSVGVTLFKRTPQGVARKSLSDLVLEYGQIAKNSVASLCVDRSYYDTQTQTFVEASAPPRPIQPAFSHDVDRWLQALAGPNYPQLNQWLSFVLDLNNPLAAIYFEGAKGAGKSLFASALATLWPGQLVRAHDATVQFNEQISRCPIVMADECLPAAWQGRNGFSAFREFIASRERLLDRKYLPKITLLGCARVILAANNPDLIRSPDMLTPNDRAGIVDRIFHIHVKREAESVLREMGDRRVRRFVENDEFAAHVHWLTKHLGVERYHRFGIESHVSQLHNTLQQSHPINAAVAEWLIKYILDPERHRDAVSTVRDGANFVLVTPENIYVNVRALANQNYWSFYVNSPDRVPSTHLISKALVDLGGRARTKVSGVRYRTIPLRVLRRFARDTQIATAAQINEGAKTLTQLDWELVSKFL